MLHAHIYVRNHRTASKERVNETYATTIKFMTHRAYRNGEVN